MFAHGLAAAYVALANRLEEKLAELQPNARLVRQQQTASSSLESQVFKVGKTE